MAPEEQPWRLTSGLHKHAHTSVCTHEQDMEGGTSRCPPVLSCIKPRPGKNGDLPIGMPLIVCGAPVTTGSPGPRPNPVIDSLSRLLGHLETPNLSSTHTHREHICSALFLSMPRNTESLVSVVGGAGSCCSPGCPKRGQVSALSHCVHAAGPEPRQCWDSSAPVPSSFVGTGL